MAAPAVEEFGVTRLRGADESDLSAPLLEQMLGRVEATLFIVGADRRPDLHFAGRAPAYEMRAALDEALKQRLVLEVIAVAEQDDPVGLAAVFVIDMPVRRQLLERDQQIVAEQRAFAHHRPEHRQIEWVDQGAVDRMLLEEQQRERPRLLAAQTRRVLVDLVIELLGRCEDSRPGRLTDRRIAAQSA